MQENIRNTPLRDEKKDFQKAVAERIREARGLVSGAAFAARCGIFAQSLKKYETEGGPLPGAALLKQICLASGVSADWLLGLSEVKLRSEVAAQRKANLDAVIEKQAAALERFSRMLDAQLPPPK